MKRNKHADRDGSGDCVTFATFLTITRPWTPLDDHLPWATLYIVTTREVNNLKRPPLAKHIYSYTKMEGRHVKQKNTEQQKN